jgi:uncharacterized cupredoxin-like copper-binding protein
MLRKIFFTIALAGLMSGCARGNQPVSEIKFSVGEFSFNPSSASVYEDEPVTFVITNDGTMEHDFVIQTIETSNIVEQGGMDMGHDTGHGMGAMDYDVHVLVQPGESKTITFTPKAVGSYEFYCTVPGHKDAGMSGELIVVEKQ